MNLQDEMNETIDQLVSSSQSSLQVDISHFSGKLESFCKEVASALSSREGTKTATRTRLRSLTLVLFAAVTGITFCLNIGMVVAGANHSQLAICNVGIAVLYVLVCMCIMADLSRGKAYFQNEREILLERLKRVAEQIRELVRERQQWANEATRAKWATDNENLRLQMAQQQLETAQEKCDLATSEFSLREQENVALLDSIRQHEATRTTLLAEIAELQNRISESNGQLESLRNQDADANEQLRVSMESRTEAAGILERLLAEVALAETTLDAKTKSANELEEKHLSVTIELERLESTIETQKNTVSKLQSDLLDAESSLGEKAVSLSQIEEKCFVAAVDCERVQADLVVATQSLHELQSEILSCEASLADKQNSLCEVEERLQSGTADLEKLHTDLSTAQSSLKDAEANRAQHEDTIQLLQETLDEKRSELASAEEKRLKAHQNHIDTMNRLVSLESQIARNQESIILGESNLNSIKENLDTKNSLFESLESEYQEIEERVAVLLAQLAELECLSAAKLATEDLRTHPSDVLITNDLTTEASESDASKMDKPNASEVEQEANQLIADELQRQALVRAELDAMRASLDERAELIEESFQKSHKLSREAEKSLADAQRRVEMLTEKSESLAEQVEAKSSELFSYKQELMSIRAEIRELEASKQAASQSVSDLSELEAKILDRRSELAMLEEQMAIAQEMITRKQQTIDDFESQRIVIQTSLESLELELSDRTLVCDRLESQNAELEVECLRLEQSKIALSSQIDSANNDLEEIHDCIQEQLKKHDELLAEQAVLRQEHELLSATNRSLQDRNEDAHFEEQKLTQLKNYSEELELQIEYSTRRLEQLSDEQDAMIEATKAQKAEFERESARMREIQLVLPDLETKLASDQLKQADLERELCEMIELIEAARDEKSEVDREVSAAKARMVELNADAAKMEERGRTSTLELQRLTDEVAEAQGIVQQWTAYMATLQSDQQQKEQNIKDLEERIEQSQNQESCALSALSAVKDELETVRLDLQDTRGEISRAEQELQSVQKSLEATILQRESEQDVQKQLRNTIQDCECESHILSAQMELAASQLVSLQESLEAKSKQRNSTEQAIEELQERLRTTERQLGDLQAERDSLTISNRESATCILEARNEIDGLERRIADLRQCEVDFHARQIDLHGLMGQIEQRQAELNSVSLEIATLEAQKKELSRIEIAYEQGQEDLVKVTHACEAAQSRLTSIESDLAHLEATRAERQKGLDRLEQMADASRASQQAIEAEVVDKQEQLLLIRNHIQAETVNLAALEQSTALRKTQSEEMVYHLEVLQKETAKLNARRKTMEDSIAERMQQESDLSEKIANTMREHEELLAVAREKMAEIQQAMISLDDQRESAELEMKDKESAIHQLESEIHSSSIKVEESKREWNSIQQAIDESKAILASTKDQIHQTKEEEQELNRQLLHAKTELNQKLAAQLQSEESLNAAQVRLQELNLEVHRLNMEMTALEESREALRSEINAVSPKSVLAEVSDATSFIADEVQSLLQTDAFEIPIEVNASALAPDSVWETVMSRSNSAESVLDSSSNSDETTDDSGNESLDHSLESHLYLSVQNLAQSLASTREIASPKADAWDSVFAGTAETQSAR